MRWILCLVVSAASSFAVGAEIKTGDATVFLSGKTVVDPPEGEPKNTHLYVSFSGEVAKTLYESMKASAIEDACIGGLLKQEEGVTCNVSEGSYECTIGINLKTSRTEMNLPC